MNDVNHRDGSLIDTREVIKMRKLLVCLVLVFTMVSISLPRQTDAAEIKLSQKKITLCEGETFDLKLVGASGTVKWKSSDKSVATFKKGKITAKKNGKATITAVYKGKKFKCKVTVKENASWTYDVTDAELKRAEKTGLLPLSWKNDLKKGVKFSEYASIIETAIDIWCPNKIKLWKKEAKLAYKSEDYMKYEDVYLMLSYLWVVSGMSKGDYQGFGGDSYFNSKPQAEIDKHYDLFSWNYPLFPDWDTIVYDIYQCNYPGYITQFPNMRSWVSGRYILPYDEKGESLHLSDQALRDASVCALLRMLENARVELDKNWGQYLSATDIGEYDHSIITDKMLKAKSTLPEVSQDKLPSEWHGAGITRKSFVEEYVHYQEQDIAFLKENGFNFTRLYLNFMTLRYPDYPKDPYLVNENELKELDQLIAWCIQYDVHLLISMNRYMDENGDFYKSDWTDMPQSKKGWKLIQTYWEMLTKRYKGIPSKYLTFELCNEIVPQKNDEEFSPEEKKIFDLAETQFAVMVNSLKSIDPDRVLLYSFANTPKTDFVEVVAKNGVAIGCHDYVPANIAIVPIQYYDYNPYVEFTWPLPLFPTGGDVESGLEPVVIKGAVGGKKLSIHLNAFTDPQYLQGTHITVSADGKKLKTMTVSGTDPQKLYSVDIPASAEEVQIQISDGYARIDTIILDDGKGNRTNILPSDTPWGPYDDLEENQVLVINNDGSYTNENNAYCDGDYIYDIGIKPYKEIADKYGVGFMVNEFGMAGSGVEHDISIIEDYHEIVLNMLEEHEIGYCYLEEANILPKHLMILYGEKSQWKGATVKEQELTLLDGSKCTVKVCSELLQIFRKHNGLK